MYVYWLMFLLPAFAFLFRAPTSRELMWLGWGTTWLTLTLLIGYRYEVGGDWENYVDHLNAAYSMGFWEAVKRFDPAHGAMNWLTSYMGWGVYGINLAYGAVFSLGLVAFCRQQPRPMLALAVAVPYLVVVGAMGYSRQGIAIGLEFFALLALAERNTIKFVVFIAIAALFHKTAVVLIPIAALASTERKVWTAVWVGATAILMYYLYLADAANTLIEVYVEAQYASQGGAIRVAMNAVPALLFLANRTRFHLDRVELALWTWMSLIALAFVPIMVLSPSSTAVDRVALYFIPIQIYVFSRLSDVPLRGNHKRVASTLVVLYYGVVLFVWLNYATHAPYWLPYRFYPLI
ncbi:MAG: EpsG family protein [Candidatus Accumulibacter meliphilus]|uniref:EpsG family protein n=1 Tax=Candidatus Accumulibacter meliphilus TaxID=2211374 RepID=A0A369XUY5_9PROT|nr:MAG: EpsG family protein [Candidatus Accumulibacter meliphilus]